MSHKHDNRTYTDLGQKIARPSNLRAYRNPDRIRGLSAVEQFQLRNEVRVMALDYLERYKTWACQDPDALMKMKHECIARFPFLNRYEGAWPLEAYLKTSLRRQDPRSRRQAHVGAHRTDSASTSRHEASVIQRTASVHHNRSQRISGHSINVEIDMDTRASEYDSDDVKSALSTAKSMLQAIRNTDGYKKAKVVINLPGGEVSDSEYAE